MRIFIGQYSKSFAFGGLEEASFVIVANTEEEAMGLALDSVSTSKREDWELVEIDSQTSASHRTHWWER